MRTRLGVLLAVSVLGAGLWGFLAADVSAQEDTQSASTSATTDSVATPAPGAAQKDRAQEASSDKAEIQVQREVMKADAHAARVGEQALLDQVHQAEQSGDSVTANSLREQLKATHQANVQQKQQDIQALKDVRTELKSDIKEARFDKMDRNNDGVVDDVERRPFVPKQEDRDNNPPGPQGGQGTNWENPPGPQGGPGAGPNRAARRDNDSNPPGPKGGPGTNWENRPGPQGGPGAGPNRSIAPKPPRAPKSPSAPKGGGGARGGGKK